MKRRTAPKTFCDNNSSADSPKRKYSTMRFRFFLPADGLQLKYVP